MSNIVKVNWYEERLHEFYETDKDNNGYIHGIYSGFEDRTVVALYCLWYTGYV